MDIDAAFAQVNNLDVPEPRRRFGPRWATIVVDKNGGILEVIRHKEPPTQALQRQHMDRYPRSVQFTTQPGLYASLEEFEAKVRQCIWVHENY
jgi:hypothetical protein